MISTELIRQPDDDYRVINDTTDQPPFPIKRTERQEIRELEVKIAQVESILASTHCDPQIVLQLEEILNDILNTISSFASDRSLSSEELQRIFAKYIRCKKIKEDWYWRFKVAALLQQPNTLELFKRKFEKLAFYHHDPMTEFDEGFSFFGTTKEKELLRIQLHCPIHAIKDPREMINIIGSISPSADIKRYLPIINKVLLALSTLFPKILHSTEYHEGKSPSWVEYRKALWNIDYILRTLTEDLHKLFDNYQQDIPKKTLIEMLSALKRSLDAFIHKLPTQKFKPEEKDELRKLAEYIKERMKNLFISFIDD